MSLFMFLSSIFLSFQHAGSGVRPREVPLKQGHPFDAEPWTNGAYSTDRKKAAKPQHAVVRCRVIAK